MSIATGVFLQYVDWAINNADDDELCDAVKTLNSAIRVERERRPKVSLKLREAKGALLKEMGERIAWEISTKEVI